MNNQQKAIVKKWKITLVFMGLVIFLAWIFKFKYQMYLVLSNLLLLGFMATASGRDAMRPQGWPGGSFGEFMNQHKFLKIYFIIIWVLLVPITYYYLIEGKDVSIKFFIFFMTMISVPPGLVSEYQRYKEAGNA